MTNPEPDTSAIDREWAAFQREQEFVLIDGIVRIDAAQFAGMVRSMEDAAQDLADARRARVIAAADAASAARQLDAWRLAAIMAGALAAAAVLWGRL